jgi:hypothetical protein
MDRPSKTVLHVEVTDEAVALLAFLDPFGYGLGALGADWIERWCRGNYFIESVETVVWDTTSSFDVAVSAEALEHLELIGRSLRRGPESVAGSIINERASILTDSRRQAYLIRPAPPILP